MIPCLLSMLLKYSFIPVFSCILGGLVLWSEQVEFTSSNYSINNRIQTANLSGGELSSRRELIEVLDRIISYQHYYQSAYGHYTKLLNKVGFRVPDRVANIYDIRVIEASQERVLVNAFSEVNGKVGDLVSIDQDFRLHSNFEIPPPRSAYLKAQAMKHLRMVHNGSSTQVVSEQGAFKGYFNYSFKQDHYGKKAAYAVGVKAPVLGMQLEVGEEGSTRKLNSVEALLTEDLIEEPSDGLAATQTQTGQQLNGNMSNLEEETRFAQLIFRGETGRYAKNLLELSKVAHFQFEGKDSLEELRVEVEPTPTVLPGEPNSLASRGITSVSSGKKLEIEPISDSSE
jgi:hypothetical protein